MTTRLILIRHGASHHKEEGVVGGVQGCRGLTAAGRHQAEALAHRLARDLSRPPAAVYCSVIPRAIETAEIIGAAWENLTVVHDCGLCTWHTPAQADGKLWAEYERDSGLVGGGVFRPFQQGNESWSELVGRTGRTLEQIAARHRHETVLVVAHAETMNASFILFGGVPLLIGFDTQVAPTSITEWFTEGDPDAWPRPRWTLARFNDSAHLSPTVAGQPVAALK